MAELLGRMAHDLNNVFATIGGFADVARESLGENHPAAEDLAQILAAVRRGTGLSARLLALAGVEPVAGSAPARLSDEPDTSRGD